MNDCKSTLQQHFLAQIQPTLHFRMLFEDLPNIIFFAKDRQGRLMMGNKLFVQHCGFQREEEIIGLTDYDIFPPELVEQYAADDLKIIESGQPKNNIVELFPNYLGDAHWFMTTKIPLFNQDHEIIGVCGTCQSYEESSNFVRPYLELSTAIDFLKNNFCKKILIDELACMVNLSTRQFERRFKDIFNTT
ncbi:MAG: AraC family transcriptional regulator, partial [Lentisphaeraceae bacterium]|nr:AraC family transcriptional regulator [Lentisphaeraceae bacterium]